MQCPVHPGNEATKFCSMCKTPLCPTCKAYVSIEPLCEKCHKIKNADANAQKEIDLMVGLDKLSEKQKKAGLNSFKNRVMAYGTLIGIVVFVNIYVFLFSPPPPKTVDFSPSQHPIVIGVMIDNAIQRYAEENKGLYPDNLAQLREGNFVSEEVSSTFDSFIYRKYGNRGYKLTSASRYGDPPEQLEFIGGIVGEDSASTATGDAK